MNKIQEKYTGLCLDSITGHDLLLARCSQGHLHIFGFYGQIGDHQKEVDINRMRVTVRDTCSECFCEVSQIYQLCWHPSMLIEGAGI